MKIIYFYHIPKCGGSYVFNLLKKLSKAVDGEFVSFINLENEKKNVILDDDLKTFIISLTDYSKKEVLFIHHHHGYPGIHELHDQILETRDAIREGGDEMIVISSVRDLLSFSISRVNYMQEKGYDITFQDLIDQPSNHNMISKYLNYNHFDRWSEDVIQIDVPSLEKSISLFDRIFLMEEMKKLTKYLNDFLGTKNITIAKRINEGKLKYLPTEEEKRRILELSQLDQHFYKMIKSRESKKPNLIKSILLDLKKMLKL